MNIDNNQLLLQAQAQTAAAAQHAAELNSQATSYTAQISDATVSFPTPIAAPVVTAAPKQATGIVPLIDALYWPLYSGELFVKSIVSGLTWGAVKPEATIIPAIFYPLLSNNYLAK
jgi:hypothetical protein